MIPTFATPIPHEKIKSIMPSNSASIIEPGSRSFLVWYRTRAIRWRVWSKHRPRLQSASSPAEKEWIRKEMEEEIRKELEAEGLHQVEGDPHSLS